MKAIISKLLNEVKAFKKEVVSLKDENTQLKEQLKVYENPKNSRNSSIPPSKDENRPKPNQSLRTSTGRKPGGQKGHKGTTLKANPRPDEIIKLVHQYCIDCGECLSEVEAVKQQARQIVDIPPIKAKYTEYQNFSKKCSCGCENIAQFPDWVNSPVSYGPNIESLTAYLHTRQYLPFKRMQELFNQVFKINISEGGIHCLLNRFAEKTTPIYDLIKQKVANSKVVGSDETGAKVNGANHYFWVWQTAQYNYVSHADNRAGATIKQHFPNGFPNSVLVHDGWKPQINTPAKLHQTCLPHLLRKLKYLNELYPNNKWGKDFISLLYDALQLKATMKPEDYQNNLERHKILQRFDYLSNAPPDKTTKKLYSFYKRMLREKQTLFVFLFIEQVPGDNNASERAIRNVKVKQKISGQFKNPKAAQNFAKIRSVIDTAIKNKAEVMKVLPLVAIVKPVLLTD